jgi:hypothetical protein
MPSGVGPHGTGCILHAGDAQGDGFSVQANMMASAGVCRRWPRRSPPSPARGCWRRSRRPRRRAATSAGANRRRFRWCRQRRCWEKVSTCGPKMTRAARPARAATRPQRRLRVATEGDDGGEGRHVEAAGRPAASELVPTRRAAVWPVPGVAQEATSQRARYVAARRVARRMAGASARLDPEIAPGGARTRGAGSGSSVTRGSSSPSASGTALEGVAHGEGSRPLGGFSASSRRCWQTAAHGRPLEVERPGPTVWCFAT